MLLSFLIRYLSRTQQTPLSLSHTRHGLSCYLVFLCFQNNCCFHFVFFPSFNFFFMLFPLCWSACCQGTAFVKKFWPFNFPSLSTIPDFQRSKIFWKYSGLLKVETFAKPKPKLSKLSTYVKNMSKILKILENLKISIFEIFERFPKIIVYGMAQIRHILEKMVCNFLS